MPRCLAGPLRRSADVEHVVEQLEGDAHPGAVAARAPRPRPALAPPARAPSRQAAANRLAVFRVAAHQVALLRHIRAKGVVSLSQLPARQRQAGLRQHAHLLGAAVAREQREGAREQEVSGA